MVEVRRPCFLFLLTVIGCAQPAPGPDKQFGGELQGALTGAGAGAITGFQLGSATGPGAAVGAGLGAVAGGIQGAVQDTLEENQKALTADIQRERELAHLHEILEDHYKKRLELHPARDIFPADVFFRGDEATLCPSAVGLVREIAHLNKDRVPWSRLVVAVYVKSADPDAPFARRLAEKRANEIGDYLARHGIEPRRIEARGVVVEAPILIDPFDHPARYNQAVEFIPLDR